VVDAEDADRGQQTVPRSRRKAILDCAGTAAHLFHGRVADVVGGEIRLKRSSCVVMMFSISELSFASCSVRVLIRMWHRVSSGDLKIG
jgi:hypothetical protein